MSQLGITLSVLDSWWRGLMLPFLQHAAGLWWFEDLGPLTKTCAWWFRVLADKLGVILVREGLLVVPYDGGKSANRLGLPSTEPRCTTFAPVLRVVAGSVTGACMGLSRCVKRTEPPLTPHWSVGLSHAAPGGAMAWKYSIDDGLVKNGWVCAPLWEATGVIVAVKTPEE